jgi:16S rRNA (uracil1498-N3)-methyltransferase
MRLHRFIVDYDLSTEPTGISAFDATLRVIDIKDQRIVRQIKTVLRLKKGDEVVLCDGKGTDARARLTAIKARAIQVSLESTAPNITDPPCACMVWCAILKKDSFEWVVQKCTEVGVTHIFPVITKRTVKTAIAGQRLDLIAREAAEQSGRGRVPIVAEPLQFEESISMAKKQGRIVFCDHSGDKTLTSMSFQKEKIVSVFIGPEGGWDPYEVDRARMSGAHIVNLGKTTLRAETAAVVASFLAVNL